MKTKSQEKGQRFGA